MFLSKLLTFNFHCGNNKPFGAINKANDMFSVQEVIQSCQQELKKKNKIQGILLFTATTDENQVITWEAILSTKNKNTEAYYKIAQSNPDSYQDEKPTVEEANLPFGYRPFEKVEIELDAAYQIAKQQVKEVECHQFKLFFPLSPMDKEPLWQLLFDDDTVVMVGANTGEIIQSEM